MRFASRSKVSDSGKLKAQRPAKPPHGAPNDGEYAHLRSLNILYDPGFELFMGNAVEHWGNDEWLDRTGVNQYTLPIYDPTCDYGQRWYTEDCVRYWDVAQWTQVNEPYEPPGSVDKSAWHVSRYLPFLGDQHLAWWDWTSSLEHGGSGNPAALMVQSVGLPAGYSARVEPGDLNSFSVWSAVPPAWLTTATPTITLSLWYYSDTGANVGVTTETFTIPFFRSPEDWDIDDFYRQHIIYATAPGGSYFIRAMVQFNYLGSLGASVLAGPFQTGGSNFPPSVFIDSGVLSIW